MSSQGNIRSVSRAAPLRPAERPDVTLLVDGGLGRRRAITAASIVDPNINMAIDGWNSARADRRMPSRRDIDPLAFRVTCLPHLFLVDVHEPAVFRYRLAGTDFEMNVGMSLRGKTVRDLPLDVEATGILPDYLVAVETGIPVYAERHFVDRRGLPISIRRVLLPLSNDGSVVDCMLGGIVFRPAATITEVTNATGQDH